MDNVFKALADPNRRKILEILREKDMVVNEIKFRMPVTGATLSHHLDILKRANLVVCERKGQFVKYSLNTSVFEEVMRLLIQVFKKGVGT